MDNDDIESQLREIDKRFPQTQRNPLIAKAVARSVQDFTGDKQRNYNILIDNVSCHIGYDAPTRKELLRDIEGDPNYVDTLIEYARQHKAEVKRDCP
jgi:hypothetical protein